MFATLVLSAVILVALLVAAGRWWARSAPPPPLGLVDGRLRPCPDRPFCVSSEDPRPDRRVAPLAFTGSPDEARARLERTLRSLERTRVTVVHPAYLRAEARSRLFRFTDDVEIRIDPDAGVAHIRSASRLGRSDFGANRSRVETVRRRFAALSTEGA